MRNVFHMVSALCCLLVPGGCTDRSYTGQYDLETPISMLLEFGASGTAAKGAGPVGTLGNIHDSVMCVTAFRENVVSLKDESAYIARHTPALVNVTDAKLDWTGEIPYYPVRERSHESYNIYAYYLSDAVSTGPARYYDERVILPLKIDGTQDLIYAKARAKARGSDEDINAFSHYSSMSGVVPVLYPEHALTCLNFRARMADNLNLSVRLEVDSLYICGLNDNVLFTVAARNPDDVGILTCGDTTSFSLALPGEGSRIMLECPKKGSAAKIVHLCPDPADSRYKYYGMLLPEILSETSIIRLKLTQYTLIEEKPDPKDTDWRKAVPHTAYCTLRHPDGLRAGMRYDILLTLSGNVMLSADAVLVPWEWGGDINVDDRNPEFE